MTVILHLETATKNCSVSLSVDGSWVGTVENATENYSHSEKLHLFIDQLLKEAQLSPQQLSAVAISKGPGSYTGLRIGVAAAKGMCYALDIPLIALDTLQILTQRAITEKPMYLIPMLDARRMEVYTAIYDNKGVLVKPTWAEVLEEHSFFSTVKDQPCTVFGEGANKFVRESKLNFIHLEALQFPSSKDMVSLAFDKFKKEAFESLAYFEPYYLKEFMTTPPNQKA